MLEHQLKSRIVALASVGRDREVKDHLRTLDMIRRASKELEEKELIGGNWVDVQRIARLHRIWSRTDFTRKIESLFKKASIISESWAKEDADRAIKLLHGEDVSTSLSAIVGTVINADIAVQSFKTALADPDFLDVYSSKIQYHIPKETWINGFVEAWAKQLDKQGVEIQDNKPYLRTVIEQILGGLGE